MNEDDELLEFETENDEAPEPVMPIAPVPVKVCEPVVTVPTVAQHLSATTLVVSTAAGAEKMLQVLSLDPLRTRATLIIHDQPVVLCHSRSQAQSAANVLAGAPRPDGAYVYAAVDKPVTLVIETTQELWVAATFDQPARVSVLQERRTT